MFAIVAIHNPPTDPDHFRGYYESIHIPLVAKIPGVEGIQYGYVDPHPDGLPGPFLICNVLFADRAAYDAASSSPELAAAAADVPNFSTGGVTICTVAFGGTD